MLDFEYGLCAESVSFPRNVCYAKTALRAAWANRGEFAGGGEGYMSVFTFPAEFIRKVDSGGSSAGYTGPCGGEFLHFDIDRPGKLHEAVLDAIKLVACLKELGFTEQNIQIWFTGKKGFDIAVPLEAFGESAKPSKQLHNHCKKVAVLIAAVANIEIDIKIYDRVRLLRAPNTQHGETGLYKTPVTLEELQDEDAVDKIRARAEAPRLLTDMSVPQDEDTISGPDDVPYMPPAGTISMCEAIWEVATSRKKKVQSVVQGTAGQQPSAPVSRATQNFIANGAPEGERATELFKAAADCTRHGWDEERVKAALTAVSLQSGLEDREIERQIRCGIAIAKRDESEKACKKAGGGYYDRATPCQEIAKVFVRYVCQPERRDLCYSNGWWEYSPKRGWVSVNDLEVQAKIMRFVYRHMQAMGDQTNLAKHYQESILSNIRNMLTVLPATVEGNEESIDPSMFLTFTEDGVTARPAIGSIACESHLINVIPVAMHIVAEMRGEPVTNWRVNPSLLRPRDSSLFAKGMVPCAFDPAMKCPRWEQFVTEVCPEDGKSLQMMFGLTLTYINWMPVFFVVYGKAGTGKSTALNILKKLNQGTTCSVSLGDYGERFQTYPLTENRLNLVADMESIFEGGAASRREMYLKLIAGKEMTKAELKYFTPKDRHLIAWNVFGSNTLPRFQEHSNAIAHRLRLLRFPNQFRGTNIQDTHLEDKLLAELPGIFIWSLVGLGVLLLDEHRTFPETQSALEEKMEAIKAADPVKLFCDEKLVREPGAMVSTREVARRLKEYCEERGYKTLGESTAIQRIGEYMDLEKKRSAVGSGKHTCFLGIRLLKEPWEEPRN